jgi:hypothetical protein
MSPPEEEVNHMSTREYHPLPKQAEVVLVKHISIGCHGRGCGEIASR